MNQKENQTPTESNPANPPHSPDGGVRQSATIRIEDGDDSNVKVTIEFEPEVDNTEPINSNAVRGAMLFLEWFNDQVTDSAERAERAIR